MNSALARLLSFGLIAGLLLSAMRAPAGLDLTQVAAVDGPTAAFFRAGALAAIALLIDRRRAAFAGGARTVPLLVSGLLGYTLHGLLLATRFEPWCRLGFGLGLIGATVLLALVAGRRRAAPDSPDGGKANGTASPAANLGAVLIGVGTVVALENLMRHARLFSLGLHADDTLMGIVFFVVLILGAVAFGRPLARPAWQRALFAGGASLAAGSSLVGLTFLAGMGSDPLYSYLLRFDLHLTSIGMWRTTALLVGAAILVPGFLTGAFLQGTLQPRRLSALLFGAALGQILFPYFVRAAATSYRWPDLVHEPWAWRFCLGGAAITFVGSLLVLGRPRSGPSPWIWRSGAIAATLGILMPLTGPRVAVWSFSPWYIIPIEPLLAMHVPEGMITVEAERGGELIVTLDRRLVSPIGDELLTDERRMTYATSLLPRDVRGEARILFIGQMTPARARLLEREGSVDRTAPWFQALPAVEELLFRDAEPPQGELIAPGEARRRITDGAYDLVLVAPARGALHHPKSAQAVGWGASGEPIVAGLTVPDGTACVVWLDAGAPLHWRDLGERVMLAMDRFEHLTLGVVLGTPAAADGDEWLRPALLPAGDPRPRPSPIEMLRTRAAARRRAAQRELCARLQEAAQGTDREALADGLGIHYGVQRMSSPYTSRAEQIQIDEEELRAFLAAARGETLDAFTRSVWESLAWVLTEKRLIDLALVYLEPIAGRFGPWEPIDRALAHAYREFDLPNEALAVLAGYVAEGSLRIDLLALCGALASEAGDWDQAVSFWRRADEVQPGRHDLSSALGKALVRAGDPAGRALLERLAAEYPDDDTIPPYLEEGGPPPYQRGYQPASHIGHVD